MSARYISGKLIKIVPMNGKNVAIEFVEKTTSWVRPSGFPSQSIQDDFVEVAESNLSKFKEGTVKVAMKESEHQSESDTKTHYTAYGINDKGDVIDIKHLYKS